MLQIHSCWTGISRACWHWGGYNGAKLIALSPILNLPIWVGQSMARNFQSKIRANELKMFGGKFVITESCAQLLITLSPITNVSIRVGRSRRSTDLPEGICPSTFFQIIVGSGSPVAQQWKTASRFSRTSKSFGPSVIFGFSDWMQPQHSDIHYIYRPIGLRRPNVRQWSFSVYRLHVSHFP
jgi:hypothetical protein